MKIFSRLLQEAKNLFYELQAMLSSVGARVDIDTPYVCQFSIPEHAEPSLKKTLDPSADPHWKETGASSPERYAAWAFTMCGMASTAMALGYFKDKNIKPAELAEDALRSGVYSEDGSEISSMKYKEFANWVRKYGLVANVYSKLSVKGIQHALSQGKLAIVSVSPNIRGYDTAPADQRGGHLVLVVGYDRDTGTISINNPSGFVNPNSQIKHSIPVATFKKYYAGRGILLSSAE